jgi:putative membrane protein
MLGWASAGLLGALAAVPAYGQPTGTGTDAWHGGSVWKWEHFVSDSLMMLFWTILVLAIAFAVWWLGRAVVRRKPLAPGSPVLANLEERFARGEIDKDEFEKLKQSFSG